MTTPSKAYRRLWKLANPEKNRAYAWRASLKRRFGLTVEQYNELIKQPCGICFRHKTRMCVDHDHRTGTRRGVLCRNCNAGVGLLGESWERLENAAKYLLRHENL